MASFTKKTVVTTVGGKLSKSVDKVMQKGSEMLDKGMEMLDAGMDMLDEALEHTETVSTTIRVSLSSEHVNALLKGRILEFKADSTTIRIEMDA